MKTYAFSRSAACRAVAIILLSSSLYRDADGARILAVHKFPGKSHWNFVSAVLRALTDAGHSVTVFTPFPDGDRENYTEVDTSALFPRKLNLSLNEVVSKYGSAWAFLPGSVRTCRDHCDLLLDDPRLQAVMRGDRGHFDLVLVQTSATECAAHVATVLGTPVAYVIAQPMIDHMERLILGHASNPAAVSQLLTDYAVPGTFAQRLANVALAVGSELLVCYHLTMSRLSLGSAKPYDLTPPAKPSAVFINSHYATDAPRPFPPNVVLVGGIHLKPVERLPQDILKFIEDSPNGVIYFTFGSMVSMTTFPDHILRSFKEALAQLPQRILWKYEGEMKDKPKNVMMRKWFPQRDILMHPNVKLFISHGGISGIYEAIDAGIPILGFPLFFDQPRNMANLVLNGMAISMDILSFTTDTLLNNIMKLINNENYKRNAKLTSERFKDRPMSPQKTVVYWVEYIIRHKGAPHLKSHALNLTWYQYYLLDVIAVLLVITSIVLSILYKVFKIIYSLYKAYLLKLKFKTE